jgi:hypothetical protein
MTTWPADDYKHYEAYNGLVKNDTTAEYHSYRILWTDKLLLWYVDNIEIKRVTDPARIPYNSTFYLFMNTFFQHEPHWPTDLDQALPVVVGMEIDFVELREILDTDPNGVAYSKAVSIIAGVVTTVLLILLLSLSIYSFVKSKKLRASKGDKQKESRSEMKLSPLNLPAFFQTASTGDDNYNSLLLRYTRLMEVSRDTLEISIKKLSK